MVHCNIKSGHLQITYMQKQGILQIKLESIKRIPHQEESCSAKVTASDVSINAQISSACNHPQPYLYLPIADKIVIELQGGGQHIGYFEIPMHAIYDYPMKKHIMKINCITKDVIQNILSPIIFGTLTLSLTFMKGCFPKIDLFIDRIVMIEFNNGQVEREVYVESKIGHSLCKTVAKQRQGSQYEWRQHMHFTLEAIPNKMELLIKDKDIVNDEILGRIQIDPQNEGFFQNGKRKEGRFELNDQQRKILLFLSVCFIIPYSQ